MQITDYYILEGFVYKNKRMFVNVQISRGTVILGTMEMFSLYAIKENTHFLKPPGQRDK